MNAAPIVTPMPVPSFGGSYTPAEETGPPQSFLLYGGKGTQKTLALGQIVRDGFYNKVLYIDLDNSTEVWATDPAIMAAVADGRINRLSIDPFDPASRMRVEEIILEVAGMWRTPDGDILVNPNIADFGFDLVAIDTVNLMHEVALKQFVSTTFNAAGTKRDGLAAYGKVAVWMDEMIRLIHNSKRFTGGFVAHAKSIEEETGARKMMVKLSGSFKDSIATIPSLVAYLDKQKDQATGKIVLVATVGNSDIADSGNRYNLPDQIFDFNLSETLAKIPNNRKVPATPAVAPAAPAAVAA